MLELWFSSCFSPLDNLREQWRDNREAIIERRGPGGRECAGGFTRSGFLLPHRAFSGPPYMGPSHTWHLHESDFDGISLQLTCIHIRNSTLHGARGRAQKWVSSFSFLHHRASGCLGLFLGRSFVMIIWVSDCKEEAQTYTWCAVKGYFTMEI